jgi:hypothetical protein
MLLPSVAKAGVFTGSEQLCLAESGDRRGPRVIRMENSGTRRVGMDRTGRGTDEDDGYGYLRSVVGQSAETVSRPTDQAGGMVVNRRAERPVSFDVGSRRYRCTCLLPRVQNGRDCRQQDLAEKGQRREAATVHRDRSPERNGICGESAPERMWRTDALNQCCESIPRNGVVDPRNGPGTFPGVRNPGTRKQKSQRKPAQTELDPEHQP